MNLLSFKNSATSCLKAALIMLACTEITLTASAQKKKDDPNKVFTAVEQSASFPGGIKSFGAFLAKTIKYPAAARNNNVEGKVFLKFIVEKDGSLADLKVLRGIGSGCDEEAVRALKNSPKWIPGKQNGKVVRQQYVVPISFSLAKA